MTRTLIVSTCGTSLFTNFAGEQRGLINQWSNVTQLHDVPADAQAAVQAVIDSAPERVLGASQTAIREASAELNALLAYLQHTSGLVIHILLHTDTWLGRESADLVRTWLADNGHGDTQLITASNLRTSSQTDFQLALSDLTKTLIEQLDAYRAQGYRIVFNLTGGFKAISGYLQTIGSIYADEQLYLFERSTELMVIPRLPVRLDAQPTFRDHLATYRRLAARLPVTPDAARMLPETLVLRLGDDAALSAWGELLWQQARDALYSEQLYTPPSTRVRYGPKFAKSIEQLPPERIAMVNARIDDLCVFIETGREPKKSATFKQIVGKPRPGQTHEMYAWSDQDARRLYGAYDGNTFVLDELGKHL